MYPLYFPLEVFILLYFYNDLAFKDGFITCISNICILAVAYLPMLILIYQWNDLEIICIYIYIYERLVCQEFCLFLF